MTAKEYLILRKLNVLDFADQMKKYFLYYIRKSIFLNGILAFKNQKRTVKVGDGPFKKQIYKLGYKLNENYNAILVYSGQVNKQFLSVENHHHISMRQDQALGYVRSFHGMMKVIPQGLLALEQNIPYDVVADIKEFSFR